MKVKNTIPADIIQQINFISPETLEAYGVIKPAKKVANNHITYICPECGNGTGEDGDGLVFYHNADKNRYHCNKKGCHFDSIALLGRYYDLYTYGKDFIELCKRACRDFGINFDFEADNDMTKIDLIKSDIETAHAAIFSVTSAVTRGLDLFTLDKYNCGYISDWTSPESRISGKFATPTPRLIIPSGNHYLARLTVPLENYDENTRKYLREKQHEGTKSLFGIEFITSDTKIVIVTEGEIDAMSIDQAVNSKAVTPVATCGTSEKKWIDLFAKKCSQLNIKPKILILFDNDDAGRTNAPKRADELIKRGYPAVVDFLSDSDEKIDANDILRSQGEISLAETIQNLIQKRGADLDKLATEIETTPATKENVFSADSDSDSDFVFDSDSTSKAKFVVPAGYQVTSKGVAKITVTSDGEIKPKIICPRVIFIKDKLHNLDSGTNQLILAYKTDSGKVKTIPAQGKEILYNKNKIVDLAKFDLPVTTSNAAKIVDFLFEFELANESNLPLTYTVNRCGWNTFNGVDFFIDPRRDCKVTDDGQSVPVIVDPNNQFAKTLKTAGTLEEWKRAYLLARPSTIARATIAASVAAPLLKLLDERNFVFYVHGKTRGGKSTALYLGASAVGAKEMVRVFDATNNGLISALADCNHYPFFVDEKQAADPKLRADFQRFIYSAANGVERARATKDGTSRPVKEWQNITLCNGETELLDDTATGGAHTRLLQIAAPDTILDAETCKEIRQIIGKNYGHALPLFLAQLEKENVDKLREEYRTAQEILQARYPNILPDHLKYVSLLAVADRILNEALGIVKFEEGVKIAADSNLDYTELLNFVPTLEEIDDTAREENIVSAFIASKSAHFEGNENFNKDRGLDIFGRQKDGFLYVISAILDKYLAENGYNAKKIVADLIASGYFIPADKIDKGKKARDTVCLWVNGKNNRCYKIKFDSDD